MLYAMKAAARRGIPVVVLDRPNPLSGVHPDGPILDSALANPDEPTPSRPGRAYALYPTPLRHGLTMGELARYFNAELKIGARLHVVPAAGWRRGDVVRRDRAALGSAVTELADARERHGVSGARPLRGLESERGAGDAGRLPGVRCAVAPGGRRGRRTRRARSARRPVRAQRLHPASGGRRQVSPGRRFRASASSSPTGPLSRPGGRVQPSSGPSSAPRRTRSSCAARRSTTGSAGRRCARRSCEARTPTGVVARDSAAVSAWWRTVAPIPALSVICAELGRRMCLARYAIASLRVNSREIERSNP